MLTKGEKRFIISVLVVFAILNQCISGVMISYGGSGRFHSLLSERWEDIGMTLTLYSCRRDGVQYDYIKREDGSAWITCINLLGGQPVRLLVPELLDGRKVTGIGGAEEYGNIFDGRADGIGIEVIILPDTMINMGEFVFYNMPSLKKVKLGEHLLCMGGRCFSKCRNLAEIDFPATIQEAINPLDPDDTLSFGLQDTAWYEMLPDGPVYCGRVFVGYKGEFSENETLFIKEGTKVIGVNALNGKRGLYKLHIPDSVTEIQYGAVASCEDLSEVSFGRSSSLRLIGDYAFSSDAHLKSIYIPKDVEELGLRALYHASSLEDISFPEKVNDIIGFECITGTKYYHGQFLWLVSTENRSFVILNVGRLNPNIHKEIWFCLKRSREG